MSCLGEKGVVGGGGDKTDSDRDGCVWGTQREGAWDKTALHKAGELHGDDWVNGNSATGNIGRVWDQQGMVWAQEVGEDGGN